MKNLNLFYVGEDDWNRPVFVDSQGNIFKDINLGMRTLELCTAGHFNAEPSINIKYMEKYKDVNFKLFHPFEEKCFRCKSHLYHSEIDGYKYQCIKCDEDFYEFEQRRLPKRRFYTYEYIPYRDRLRTCPLCKHKQELKLNENIGKDIKGQYTICNKCTQPYFIEYKLESILVYSESKLYKLTVLFDDGKDKLYIEANTKKEAVDFVSKIYKPNKILDINIKIDFTKSGI